MTEEKIIIHGDPDLEDLIPGFLENRRNDVDKLRSCIDSGDFEAIRVLGHSMKGAGGGYGFDAITEYGASIEAAAKGEDTASLAATTEALESYLERVEVVYD